jgi:hypothetical protein
LNTCNLLKEDYREEENIIHSIMHNNSFPIHPQRPSTRKLRRHLDTTQTAQHKWATFTYTGKKTTFITNFSGELTPKLLSMLTTPLVIG